MKLVRHLLETKSTEIYSVTKDISVFEALKVMMDKNISALLVMEYSTLQGIFTERDYARKIILQGKSSKETAISEVMTSKLLTITKEDSIDHCMQLMTEKHIRHLPVLDAGVVVGLVSIGDVVKYVIQDQKQTIKQLESYITS
ncbi:MAG: histidine kinase [Sphingobacteriales bacterium]|nr:histidine kinase [Sphingobacteriales bacterium]